MVKRRKIIFGKERKKEQKKERKWKGKGTRQERKYYQLKRNKAGTKIRFTEKERGRNGFLKVEERPMPIYQDQLEKYIFPDIFETFFFILAQKSRK